LVPSQWRDKSQLSSVSSAAYAYILALVALFAPFYFPRALTATVFRKYASNYVIWCGAIVGILVSVISPTSHDHSSGRWGGYLWAAVEHLPIVLDRSVVFVVLAPIGGMLLAALIQEMLRSTTAWQTALWSIGLVAWASAFVINRQIFQRYYEPTLLIFLILAVAEIIPNLSSTETAVNRRSLVLFLCFQTAITVVTVYH
jgi:hypothetical protein